jgi:predicted transport protein
MALAYISHEKLNLKAHPEYTEKWIQDLIADNPAILGLGELDLRDKERPQPRAGRLDLLLQDPESLRRYEVELQLGATDETHIIRTLEYWDIERKRYPQYDHCAVLIAEDITSRFLNVMALFNGTIPFIAIQMNALKIENNITLVFTTVMDEMRRGLVEDDEEVSTQADRTYWVDRATEGTVALAEALLQIVRKCDPNLELKYNKHYIGLAHEGQPFNFVTFRPKKSYINLDLKLPLTDDVSGKIDAADIETLEYNQKWGTYRLRLTPQDIRGKAPVLEELIRLAYQRRTA